MRSGTTSVHAWIASHPDASMSRKKELSFFVAGPQGNWERGLEWYADWFDARAQVRGESSPKYTKSPIYAGVPQRMHAILPGARLLYLVRDPIERLLSHYRIFRAKGMERRPLAQALGDPETGRYIVPGRYFYQLSQYRALYPDERILVVSLEELQRDPAGAMGRILDFCGLSREGFDPKVLRAHNAAQGKGEPTWLGRQLQRRIGRGRTTRVGRTVPLAPRLLYRRGAPGPAGLDDATRARLVDVYAPDIAALRSYTGQAFPDWSV